MTDDYHLKFRGYNEGLLNRWRAAKVIADVYLDGVHDKELSDLAADLLRREQETLWNRAVLATVHEELANDLEDPEFPSLRLSGPAYLAPEATDG
jgi:hypothetical protein